MLLYAHPFSSYCQKVLIALYENGTPFEMREIGSDELVDAEFAQLWPMRKMPVLVDEGKPVCEATIIVEHLDLHHRGAVRFLPDDAAAALDVRFLDRFFDNYVMTPMQRIVADFIREPAHRDAVAVEEGKALLERSYRWLDGHLSDGREWAAGAGFGLADCAAAPSMFYADWVHAVPEDFAHVRAYRARLLARPSFARAVDEARRFRHFFPPGAPDRD